MACDPPALDSTQPLWMGLRGERSSARKSIRYGDFLRTCCKTAPAAESLLQTLVIIELLLILHTCNKHPSSPFSLLLSQSWESNLFGALCYVQKFNCGCVILVKFSGVKQCVSPCYCRVTSNTFHYERKRQVENSKSSFLCLSS